MSKKPVSIGEVDQAALLAVNQANEAIARKNFVRAEVILNKLHEDPSRRSYRSALLSGVALEAQQKYMAAAEAYKSSLSFITDSRERVQILNRTADLLFLSGDRKREVLEKIADCLERSVALDESSNSMNTLKKLCEVYLADQNYRALASRAAELLNWRADAETLLWLLQAFFFLDEKQKGISCLRQFYRNTQIWDDRNVTALFNWLVKFGLLEEAQEVIDRTTVPGRNDNLLKGMQAEIYFLTGRHQQVLDTLSEQLIGEQGSSITAVRYYGFRAGSLRALGKYPQAQCCFTVMNEMSRSMYDAKKDQDYVADYRRQDLDSLPRHGDDSGALYQPVFMIGFPRSGTTLLETVLDSQDGITTLSERNGIGYAIGSLRKSGRVYPEGLWSVTNQDLIRMKKAYFDQHHRFLPEKKHFDVVIDKLPLNIIHIPLINMMFPSAKYIFSLRHPLDICVSCFQQNFALNEEMVHFTDLGSCFSRYAAVMGLFEIFRSRLELNIHTVRYEALVENFSYEAREVFKFLGYEENDEFLSFYEKNRNRIVNTPSDNQVIRPIYQSSRNRWKSYRSEIEPFVSMVQRFVDEYGYSV